MKEKRKGEKADGRSDQAGKITLVPQGGLGQRLCAVASTIALARQYHRPLEIIWFRTDSFDAPSDRLFTLDAQMRREHITIREAKWSDHVTARTPMQSNLWLTAPFLLIGYDDVLSEDRVRELLAKDPERLEAILKRRHRRLLIETGQALTEAKDMYKPILPTIEVINVRNSRLSSWHNNIVGIHIDRSTKVSTAESPTELFIRRMYEMIVADPTTSFFVTTTSHDERERLQTLYRSRIVAPSSMSDGSSVDGLIESYGDLLALSQTVKILTTPNSAYTAVAASIGRILSESLSIYSSPTIITK